MSSSPALSPDNILIVDDNPTNLRLLSQILMERGYHVRAVTSGARALASIHAGTPDLVLLDIRMPEMDGYQVCEQLKGDARTREIPIIFISALDEIQDKLKAFTVGGVDYVTKPFQVEEVLARVATHLSLRKLQRQLQSANQKMERELALAGEVQFSFLPKKPPELPGWQFSVSLLPAQETSGDFYDIIQFPDGRVGLLVADVVEKGVGAALYMAMSSALIRSYALEHPHNPELVLKAVNQRILDTNAWQFVTVFYAVLDPVTGQMVYANAGHWPPFLVRPPEQQGLEGQQFATLTHTGIPLGIYEDQNWEAKTVDLSPGDVLVLYTDGIIEAENAGGDFYGKERLLKIVRAGSGQPAEAIKDAILYDLHQFIQEASLLDDIALMIVQRSNEVPAGTAQAESA